MSRRIKYAPNTLQSEQLFDGCRYSATGVLDDTTVRVGVCEKEEGWIEISFGPVKLTISTEAAPELARHLIAASTAGGVQ